MAGRGSERTVSITRRVPSDERPTDEVADLSAAVSPLPPVAVATKVATIAIAKVVSSREARDAFSSA